MNLAPLEMSVPAGDGLILKGTLSYPRKLSGTRFPLAVLAHQYPATRDSYSPLVADLGERGVATLRDDPFAGGENVSNWNRGLSHVTGRIVPGSAHGMAIYFEVRDDLLHFLRQSLAPQ